jgi:hypothetical protein
VSEAKQIIPNRSLAPWAVALVVLIVLWLPSLPCTLHVTDIPAPLLNFLLVFKAFKPDEKWSMRWDYFLLPPLFIYTLWVTWKSRASAYECGLTFRNFGPALKFLFLPTLVGGIVLILLGIFSGVLSAESFGEKSRFWKGLIPIPAFFQQMAIQLFFHRQLMPWFGTGRKTAWILTLFFVLLHAPNPGLMLGTLFGMYFWARCYQVHPNLYALAISHAFLSALLMSSMPKGLLPSVSVGWRFIEKGIANSWWNWSF